MVSEFLRKERNGKTLLYANVLSKDFLLRVNNSGFYVKCWNSDKNKDKFFRSSAGEKQAVQPRPSGMSKPLTHEEQLAIGVTTSTQELTVNLRQPSVSTEGLPTKSYLWGTALINWYRSTQPSVRTSLGISRRILFLHCFSFNFLSWLSSVMACKLQMAINPFLPNLCLVRVFYHSIREKTRTSPDTGYMVKRSL